MSEAITGVKRPWEPGAPPDAPPPIYESDETGDGVTPSEPLSSAPPAVPPPPVVSAAVADHAAAAEEHALTEEAAWLRQQNLQLQQQLAQLQQQHMALMAAHQQQLAVRGAAAVHHGAAPLMQPMVPAVTAPAHVAHNPAWTEQVNPENNQTYYWNSVTGESTYTKPPDYNPPGAATVAGTPLLNVKGPPGANLFVVRKMRRGEYDEFTDEDLRREFSKYGTVTRAEMTVDKETGWSKGFGFVSFSSPQEADAALQAVHGSWMAGREMKVEKTRDN